MTGRDANRPKPARQRIAKLAASALGRIASPLAVFRATGIMPCVPSKAVPDTLADHPDPPPFDRAAPGTRDGGWTPSRRHTARPTRVVSVANGIALPAGAVFDRHGRFVASASHDRDFEDSPARTSFAPSPHRFRPRIRAHDGAVVVLTASNQRFYFHWLFDVLPRLWLAERAGFGAGPFYVDGTYPFQRRLLQLLGLSDAAVISAEAGAISASRLIVPCHRVMPGHAFPDWAVRFLRDRLMTTGPEPRSESRLFVSRDGAGHRRLINEREVVELLSNHGFESVRLENLPCDEQIGRFRSATTVIAPHGGGLANLVFCSPGTRVIELFPSGSIDLYYRLATALDLDYSFVKSRGEPDRVLRPEDYRIEPADLESTLNA